MDGLTSKILVGFRAYFLLDLSAALAVSVVSYGEYPNFMVCSICSNVIQQNV